MSLHPQAYPLPEDTARVAQAAFPKGNRYLTLAKHFGMFFSDTDFERAYASDGQPALSPVRLMLVLVLQFIEDLSDRQAAEAVRSRIDWKYFLRLPLEDAGFDSSVLSEFRTRLQASTLETQLFEKILTQFKAAGLLKKRGVQRTDATHILTHLQSLPRLEFLVATFQHALNTVAALAPAWLWQHQDPAWVARYQDAGWGARLPKKAPQRAEYQVLVGKDGIHLLEKILGSENPADQWLRQLPAVRMLWQVWIQQFTWDQQGNLRARTLEELPPASLRLQSPHDPEVRICKKRSMTWLGYKVHLTETCEPTQPRLITHVETTPATQVDVEALPAIHAGLAQKELLPATHLADSGYVDAANLVESQATWQVDLCGPTREDNSWQAKQGAGFAAAAFEIFWEEAYARCPQGHRSLHWLPALNNRGKEIIQIKFSKRVCGQCPQKAQCTRAASPRRTITVRPEKQHQALQQARAREKTPAYKKQYAQRAGIEGTISQTVRALGMRQTRYIGLAKTHLQHLLTATAINLQRVAAWLSEEVPAKTRTSAYGRLCAAMVA